MLNQHVLGILFALVSGKQCELSSDSYLLVKGMISEGALEWSETSPFAIYLASERYPISLTQKGRRITEDVSRALSRTGLMVV